MTVFNMLQIQIFTSPSWSLSPRLLKLTEPIAIRERLVLENGLGLYLNEIAASIAHPDLICSDIKTCIKKHGGLLANDVNLCMLAYEISNIIRRGLKAPCPLC